MQQLNGSLGFVEVEGEEEFAVVFCPLSLCFLEDPLDQEMVGA